MKQGVCPKCKTYTWLQEHHILPLSIFGETIFKTYICSNCHTDIHQKLGKMTSKEKDFYLIFHIQWLMGILMVIFLIGVLLTL